MEASTILFALLVVTSSWSLTVSFPMVDIPRIPHVPSCPAPHRCCCQATDPSSSSYQTSVSLALIPVLPALVSGEMGPCNCSSPDKPPPTPLSISYRAALSSGKSTSSETRKCVTLVKSPSFPKPNNTRLPISQDFNIK